MIKILATLVGLASLSPALARPVPADPFGNDVWGSKLKAVSSQKYMYGSIEYDASQNSLSLMLQPQMPPCPRGMACAAVMPQLEQISLLDAEVTADRCGTIYIEAEKDLRPVDGALERVVLADHRLNQCPTFAPQAPTTVRYEVRYYDRRQGREVIKKHYFEGPELQLVRENPDEVAFAGNVQSARFEGGQLTLELEYSGGCHKHDFKLHWGDCDAEEILNTVIKRCDVNMIHTMGYDDPCEALIREKRTFDLSHLGAAYLIDIHDIRVLVH